MPTLTRAEASPERPENVLIPQGAMLVGYAAAGRSQARSRPGTCPSMANRLVDRC